MAILPVYTRGDYYSKGSFCSFVAENIKYCPSFIQLPIIFIISVLSSLTNGYSDSFEQT